MIIRFNSGILLPSLTSDNAYYVKLSGEKDKRYRFREITNFHPMKSGLTSPASLSQKALTNGMRWM
jgi:hypothetical protein